MALIKNNKEFIQKEIVYLHEQIKQKQREISGLWDAIDILVNGLNTIIERQADTTILKSVAKETIKLINTRRQ
jgi:hypothetical protein